MADADFESFFGGNGGTSGSVVPVFRRKRAVLNRSGGFYPDGFVGDGDYIRLPAGPANTIEYYNASGSLVWSHSPSAVFTGSTDFVSFALSVGGLLYCFTTALPTGSLRLSTVNAAGTVVQIGAGFTPSPAITSADAWEPGSNVDAAGCQIDGANLVLFFEKRIVTVNATTGALVTDAASRCVKGSTRLGSYLFAVEFGIAGITQFVTYRLRRDSGSLGATGDVVSVGSAGSQSAFSQSNQVTPFLSWKNEVLKCSSSAANPLGAPGDYCLVFDAATLAADVSTLAANLRFNI